MINKKELKKALFVHDVTVTMIAEAANVSESTVYRWIKHPERMNIGNIEIIKEAGESETNIFEGDGKGYAIMLANATFFNIEHEALVEGGASILLYNVDCEALETFELVSYERTGDLIIDQAEETQAE